MLSHITPQLLGQADVTDPILQMRYWVQGHKASKWLGTKPGPFVMMLC